MLHAINNKKQLNKRMFFVQIRFDYQRLWTTENNEAKKKPKIIWTTEDYRT